MGSARVSIRITTLGGFRVLEGGKELGAFQGQPLRSALLVYLAVEGRTTRDRLLGTLWPEKDGAKARSALNSTLHELGKSLGDRWRDGRGEVLQIAPSVSVDTSDFVAAVEREDHEGALDLYEGAFLDGTHLASSPAFEQWADQMRSYLASLHRRTRTEFVSTALADGNLAAALDAAQDWVELEPLEDEAHHRCIELLARSGHAAQALLHFEQYRQQLARELDLEPMPETIALVDRIRAGAVAVERPSRAAAGRRGTDSSDAAGSPAGIGAGDKASDPSVVVLPFLNLSAEPDNEYFSDGMTEEIITALSRRGGLRLAAATSSFALKGTAKDVREIGRLLGAAWAVEGSVRKFGAQLRISARLVDAGNGYELWCGAFDRELKDVFAIQNEIAWAIADALAPHLGPRRYQVARDRTPVPEAYDVYLLGRHFYGTRSPGGLEKAIHYYGEALAHDPDYALAWAGLADSLIAQAHFQYRPPRDVAADAETAAAKALELAPDVAEVQCTSAHIQDTFNWQWAEAEKGYRRAIALDSSYAHARIVYADLLTILGRHDEAAVQTQQAEELEPLSMPIKFQKASQLYRTRRYDEALAVLGRTFEMAPRHYPTRAFQGMTLIAMGRVEEAIALIDASLEQFHQHPALQMVRGHGLGVSGRKAEAREVLHALDGASRARYVPALLSAIVLGGMKDLDAAFASLERAAEERYPQMNFLAVDPIFDPLACDRRFAAFLERMGLPAATRGAPEPRVHAAPLPGAHRPTASP